MEHIMPDCDVSIVVRVRYLAGGNETVVVGGSANLPMLAISPRTTEGMLGAAILKLIRDAAGRTEGGE